MNPDYADDFRQAWSAQPLRHLLRLADFQAQWLTPQRATDRRDLRRSVAEGSSIVPTPGLLRPPPHHYQGYRGPWIEDYFFRHWLRVHPHTEVVYLPVFWTDLYLHAQTHRLTPRQFAAFESQIRELLDRRVADNRCYFTVLEYDHMIWDWHLFPRNVAVFSAGGWGDVPVPLLKGSPAFTCREKNIKLSFVGRVDGASDATGVRRRMYNALRDHALFTSGTRWREVMSRSTFSLCPRGLGRASFRFYEALSVGSIPVYIWDDCEWLPYRDRIDWTEIAISLPIGRIKELPAMLAALAPARVAAMQRRIAELYDEFFTLEGMSRQIIAEVERLADRLAFRELMKKRPYPPGTVPQHGIPEFLEKCASS
ncbi:MAG: exostosin family protein [Opitutaceae bacterium]|nr:exostosin family protein [Opitutaceae bacterium]